MTASTADGHTRKGIVRPDVACDRASGSVLRLRMRLRPEPVIFLDCLTVAAREYAKRIKQERQVPANFDKKLRVGRCGLPTAAE
jgi:hypothetical protein